MHILWYAQIHTVLSVDIDIFCNESFNWLTDWLIHYIKICLWFSRLILLIYTTVDRAYVLGTDEDSLGYMCPSNF